MAGQKKIGLDLSELEDYIARFEGYENELKRAIEAALLATKREITSNLQEDMKKHRQTGITEAALNKEYKVQWEGTRATIKLGFKFPDGFPSIMLMYGTPRMAKDRKLYNDIYGATTRNKAKQLQAEAMEKVLRRIGGG